MIKDLFRKIVVALFQSIKGRAQIYERTFQRKQRAQMLNLKFGGSNEIIHTLFNGTRINLDKDNRLSEFILLDDFEAPELNFCENWVKDDSFFLDIGTNIGLYSVLLAKKVEHVYSFEPHPKVREKLAANLDLNNYTNVTICPFGISNQKDVLTLISNRSYDAWSSFSAIENLEKVTEIDYTDEMKVDVIPLDKWVDDVFLDFSKVGLVKIDVEGWELNVLKGGARVFEKWKPLLLVEFDENNTWSAGYTCSELYRFLVDLGYLMCEIKEGKLIESPLKVNYPSQNLFAINPKNEDHINLLTNA
ncbi:MAG: FkbM family methyltransferase [Luteibaculaceae bacterium]